MLPGHARLLPARSSQPGRRVTALVRAFARKRSRPMPAVLAPPVSTGSTVPHGNGTAPPGASDLSATVMAISPPMAADLLKGRLANRPLNKTQVRRIIDDIRQGRWRLNGESIILDHDLHVLDGQHRLQAISEAGITVEALVVVGADPQVIPSIDQGSRRNG